MKINLTKTIAFVCMFIALNSSAQTVTKDLLTDPVTGNKVDKTESFDLTYAGKKYYFSSYDSRAAFKLDPQKYLLNKCTANMTTVDPVSGRKVNMEESYDMKYNGKVYHFESAETKETFKMNPEKFLKNKCAASADTTK